MVQVIARDLGRVRMRSQSLSEPGKTFAAHGSLSEPGKTFAAHGSLSEPGKASATHGGQLLESPAPHLRRLLRRWAIRRLEVLLPVMLVRHSLPGLKVKTLRSTTNDDNHYDIGDRSPAGELSDSSAKTGLPSD